MESVVRFVWIARLFINLLNDLNTFKFLNSSKIMPPECRNDFKRVSFIRLSFFRYTVKFGDVTLPDYELDDILSIKIPFLIFQDRDELYAHFLLFDQINGRDHLFKHVFDDESELIHLFSTQGHAFDLAGRVIDAHENSAAFGVHEGDNGFDEDTFEIIFLDGYCVVLELNGHAFKRERLVEKEIAFAAETGMFNGDRFNIHGANK